MKKILFIALLLPSAIYAQECTKMVNGVKLPCTQAEIHQRAIDSIQAEVELKKDSLANIEAIRIRNAARSVNGTPYNKLTAEQRNSLNLYLLMRTNNLDLINKTVDIKNFK